MMLPDATHDFQTVPVRPYFGPARVTQGGFCTRCNLVLQPGAAWLPPCKPKKRPL